MSWIEEHWCHKYKVKDRQEPGQGLDTTQLKLIRLYEVTAKKSERTKKYDAWYVDIMINRRPARGMINRCGGQHHDPDRNKNVGIELESK